MQSIKRKLFRVDIDLKYLFLTEREKIGPSDVLEWLHDVHSGELDDEDAVSILEITDDHQIDDFDREYGVYSDIPNLPDGTYVSEVIEDLHLDTGAMIKKLEALGYKITKNKQKV